jgi:hypothetical protein
MKHQRIALPQEPQDVIWDVRLKASISLYGRDRGTAERWGKSRLVEVGSREGHAVDEHANPFMGYYRRQLLSDSPYRHRRGEENEVRHEAGLRFQGAWERLGRRPRVIARLTGAPSGGGWHDGGGVSWAPWAEAYLAMRPWGACVQAVVCFDESAKGWFQRSSRLRRPGHEGMMVLRLGLERLVSWYAAVDKSGRRY